MTNTFTKLSQDGALLRALLEEFRIATLSEDERIEDAHSVEEKKESFFCMLDLAVTARACFGYIGFWQGVSEAEEILEDLERLNVRLRIVQQQEEFSAFVVGSRRNAAAYLPEENAEDDYIEYLKNGLTFLPGKKPCLHSFGGWSDSALALHENRGHASVIGQRDSRVQNSGSESMKSRAIKEWADFGGNSQTIFSRVDVEKKMVTALSEWTRTIEHHFTTEEAPEHEVQGKETFASTKP